MIMRFATLVVASLACHPCALAEPPADLDPRLQLKQPGVRLTLMAEHPDVVTPTGIDVDGTGRIWAICSHTHFRPDDYDGPEHDEVIVYQTDRLPGANARTVFYNKTDATMDLELEEGFEPGGWVYLAERDRILRVRDSDGDGRGDQEEDLAVLETEADYPHNGLSGLAWHPSGDLIFALGENFWKDWTLTSRDGASVVGTGEGGVFRCRPDGTGLRRIARGFWNPFGVCVREDGTMFAAENDPGARPPCRLLHVVEGGDYGYQRRYGSSPFHPFACWNGELRGTLPMLHALAEAPCGIAPLGNGLIVPSWTDHRIDFYPLTPKGASFATKRVNLVTGEHHFRPTCITQVSPTIYYLTDWVFGSYQLHKRGRVWKLEIDPELATWLGDKKIPAANKDAKRAAELRAGGQSFSDEQLFQLARSQDPFVRRAAIDALSQRTGSLDQADAGKLDEEDRINLLLAIRKANPKSVDWARYFLGQSNQELRFETLRWIADEQLDVFKPDVEAMLSDSQVEFRIYEACLATWNTLSGNASLGTVDAGMLMTRVSDSQASPRTRAFALRLLDTNQKQFNAVLWRELYDTRDPLLVSELARALGSVGSDEAISLLLRIAEDERVKMETRADAIAGLSASNEQARMKLVGFSQAPQRPLRDEALRSLRFAKLTAGQRDTLRQVAEKFPESADLARAAIEPESLKSDRPKPENIEAWQKRLASIDQAVDISAGRRIFQHGSVGTCVKCHRHTGRGSAVGPDLSAASNEGDPDRLLRAILQPSRDVDPQYFPRMLVTEDGHVFTGIMLRDGGGGTEFYRDNTGREKKFSTSEIVERKELRTSMMPDGLIDLMTDREIRDLLAFLDGGSNTNAGLSEADLSEFLGTWWLDTPDGYGGWLSVDQVEQELHAKLLWRVGSANPMRRVRYEHGQLVMERSRRQETNRFIATVSNDVMTVKLDGTDQTASGRRCPPLPPRPDLEKVRFGNPIELFNGHDLSGWQLQPQDARNGWSAVAGELVNNTPKQDFSAYGAFGNLRTTRVFGDCKLHIEFNIGSKRNSGVYVRGLYEAQVVDRDSPMQGINGPGAIFGRIAPTKNAGLPGGEWQTYDITLVDRHITVELNGQRVIDNQPVDGCTGGALHGNVASDGPVYLQGDHTSVRYRNIRIRPRITDKH